MQNACMHAAKLLTKLEKSRHLALKNPYKISLHFAKFLQKLPATWKSFGISRFVLGSNLLFLGPEHRFLPLNQN